MRQMAPSRSSSAHSAPAKLARPDEQKWRKPKRGAHDEAATVGSNRAHQGTYFSGVRKGAVVAPRGGWQGATQICAGIPRSAAGRDRVAEDPAAGLLDAMRGRQVAAGFDLTEHAQQLGSFDFANRFGAE